MKQKSIVTRLDEENMNFLNHIVDYPPYLKSFNQKIDFLKHYIENGGIIKKETKKK